VILWSSWVAGSGVVSVMEIAKAHAKGSVFSVQKFFKKTRFSDLFCRKSRKWLALLASISSQRRCRRPIVGRRRRWGGSGRWRR
jgi:hypothetical protein